MLLKKNKLGRDVLLYYNDLHKISVHLHSDENFYFTVSYCLNSETEFTVEITHFIFYCRASTWNFKCFGSWRSLQFLWILRSCCPCLTIISFRLFHILHFLRPFLPLWCRWSVSHTFSSGTHSWLLLYFRLIKGFIFFTFYNLTLVLMETISTGEVWMKRKGFWFEYIFKYWSNQYQRNVSTN